MHNVIVGKTIDALLNVQKLLRTYAKRSEVGILRNFGESSEARRFLGDFSIQCKAILGTLLARNVRK